MSLSCRQLEDPGSREKSPRYRGLPAELEPLFEGVARVADSFEVTFSCRAGGGGERDEHGGKTVLFCSYLCLPSRERGQIPGGWLDQFRVRFRQSPWFLTSSSCP